MIWNVHIRISHLDNGNKLYNTLSRKFEMSSQKITKEFFMRMFLSYQEKDKKRNFGEYFMKISDIKNKEIEQISTLLQNFLIDSVEDLVLSTSDIDLQVSQNEFLMNWRNGAYKDTFLKDTPMKIGYMLYDRNLGGFDDLVDDVINNRIDSTRICYGKSKRIRSQGITYKQNIGLSKSPIMEPNGTYPKWPGINWEDFNESIKNFI